MSLMDSLKRVIEYGVDDYTAPRHWEINGVDIWFKPEPNGVSASEWKDVLDKWLPKFQEVGWLDGLYRINIGKDIVSGEAVGQYMDSGVIYLENDVSIVGLGSSVVSDTSKHVLTHEIIHHAHRNIHDVVNTHKIPSNRQKIRNEVSYYAGKCTGETVAEIGTGIVHGEEFDEWVHDEYDKYGGPQEVYEIG